jgi:hypothetical protein
MEIFVGLYMRPRLSPLLSLKCEAERVKTELFGCLRLVLGFLVFVVLLKNCAVLHVFSFGYLQVGASALVRK